MAILSYIAALWGSLESSLVLMLENNELSSAESLRQSKYVLRAIDNTKQVIKRARLEAKERATLEELIMEFDHYYRAATDVTQIDGKSQFLCDVRASAGFYRDGFEAELIVLKSRIEDRFLPDIRRMLTARPLVIMEPPALGDGADGRTDGTKELAADLSGDQDKCTDTEGAQDRPTPQGNKDGLIRIKLDDFSATPSHTLLEDLLRDTVRKGVTYDENKHGKDQPKTLRKNLRTKGLEEVARKIYKEKNTITLKIDSNKIEIT